MKKIVCFMVLFLLIFAFLDTASASEKDKQIAVKQGKLIEKFEKELMKMELKYGDIHELGNFYFDNDKMVIQVDEFSKQENNKLEKLKKIAEKIEAAAPEEFMVETVKYNYDELVIMQDNVANEAKKLGLDNFVVNLNMKHNNLTLIIADLSNEDKQFLNDQFGSVLKIEIDKETKKKYERPEESFKARKANWNSLGAGIGIENNGGGGCSTAGIATKDTRMWVMTAGHCNDDSDENDTLNSFDQWSATLGETHLDSEASDYDFLLIEVQGSYLSRYATNGLYSSVADTSYGYDEELTGSFFQTEGLRVCKVGITTDRTCGEVEVARTQQFFGTGDVVSVVTGDGTALSGPGDSGGAWFTQSKPFRLVGIHEGGSSDLANDYSSESEFTPWGEVAEKYGLQLYRTSTPKAMN